MIDDIASGTTNSEFTNDTKDFDQFSFQTDSITVCIQYSMSHTFTYIYIY